MSEFRGKVNVAGGQLAYEAAGDGAPVLFLHSVITDSRLWDREIPIYSKDHRTVRFDIRGFGGSSPARAPFSYTDDVAALVDHLGLKRPYLVGSSMGGSFAVDFALAHPDQVRGLLLVAPGLSGGFAPPFDAAEQAAFEYDEQKSKIINDAWSRGDRASAVDALRQLWCAALTGPELELFRRMVSENAEEVFDNRSMRVATDPPPAAGHLSEIAVPTTVLIGDRDNPSSAVFAKRIASAIPGARLVSVPGADHLINLSRPDAFDAALRAGLLQTGSSPGRE